MKVVLFFPALALMLMLHVTAHKLGKQCDVPVKSNICQKASDCSPDKCVITGGNIGGSCFPVCGGIMGITCTPPKICCYDQYDGTYATSMAPYMNDDQGACL